MKFSLSATFAIVAIASFVAWRNHVEITTETRAYEQVQEKARSLGIPADPISSPRGTRSQRAREPDAKTLVRDLIAFAKELETQPEPGTSTALDDREQQMLDWQSRLLALEPAAMKALIAEINAAEGMTEGSRQDLLSLVLETLAESHPQTALEVLGDFPDLIKNPETRANAASIALVNGMKSDPAATVDWYKSHRALFPGETGVWVTERLLRGTSLIDPELAFPLISELELSDAEYAVVMITNPPRTFAQQDATLSALREYLATVQDPVLRETLTFAGNNTIISGALRNNIDEGIRWIGDGRFTPEEIEMDAERCFRGFTSDEQGKWLGWLIQAHPTDKVFNQILPQHFSDWVQVDYRAAGEWLGGAADGPAKTAAAGAYASSIAAHFPEIAAKWALTLPPGENRDQLLPRIYQSWLKKDPTAAASFAERNGIVK